ncbi:hypothetical protein [Streptomyces hydrogenans]|uniref:hypothetical protein n=1 Tax=Streptomyces hydrogenans TaxID=1873719 RepID=UPI0036B886CF
MTCTDADGAPKNVVPGTACEVMPSPPRTAQISTLFDAIRAEIDAGRVRIDLFAGRAA